jgi:hypothetical protein
MIRKELAASRFILPTNEGQDNHIPKYSLLFLSFLAFYYKSKYANL